MSGAKCGDLVFRNEEFEQIRRAGKPENPLAPIRLMASITFINESKPNDSTNPTTPEAH
jgi:hypothetical protein